MRAVVGTFLALMAGSPAIACTNVDGVLAHYDTVLEAYIAKAPSMSQQDFAVWTSALEMFGDRMGKQDFAGACAAVDTAAAELGFGTEAFVGSTPSSGTAQQGGGDIEIPLAPSTEGAVPRAEHAQPRVQSSASAATTSCGRGRCSTWRLPL